MAQAEGLVMKWYAVAIVFLMFFAATGDVSAQQPTSSPTYEKCAMADPPEPTPLTCEKPACRRACKIRRARRACAWGQRKACARYKKLLKARCKCGRCVVVIHRF